uniref:Cytochrome c oxidase subunit 3 n=1 Tax=Aleyrodes shizuokensis TaxID=860392 RepID=A0A7T1NLW3_9HEMI|nr:cytochrome c oxidase subunit III [Aleyrodes shizuokensis]QPO06177.1 cytochrome c oxidase subunit III [Aleyrodes shizuokensis]
MLMNNHCFHLVSCSPWPILISLNFVNVGFSLIFLLLHHSCFFFFFFFFILVLICIQWWRDIIREGLYLGSHLLVVSSGLSMGIIFFIVSEFFFFVSFFWMYFYYSLSPDMSLGLFWPPQGVGAVNYMDLPFLNTLVLLSSGFFITWSHYGLFVGDYNLLKISYLFCIFMGFYFFVIQMYEYHELFFDFSDGVFGCSFFILTGFHGFHVLLGLIFLSFNFYRFYCNNFSFLSFYGFEYSIWYWHFVDLIWLFLYVFLYWWGM